MLESEAKTKFCPFAKMFEVTNLNKPGACIGRNCIMWEFYPNQERITNFEKPKGEGWDHVEIHHPSPGKFVTTWVRNLDSDSGDCRLKSVECECNYGN